jgi:hypothetical protein
MYVLFRLHHQDSLYGKSGLAERKIELDIAGA